MTFRSGVISGDKLLKKLGWYLCLLMTSSLVSVNADEKEIYNDFGINVEQAYISDLNTYWHYRSVYYKYINDLTSYTARINHSNRFGSAGDQYMLETTQVINADTVGYLAYAYAKNNQVQYPSAAYRLEVYETFEKQIELSLGTAGLIYSMFENQKIYSYTGSAGLYFGSNFAWIRPTFYSVHGKCLIEMAVRKYFKDRFSYVTLSVNFGQVPDIGDLPPLDQLVIASQRGIGVSGQFSLFGALYMQWNFSYERMLYPQNLLRRITDAYVGLMLHL